MTTYMRDADIPFMLADFGVPVVYEGVRGKGLVDYVDSVTLRENGIGGVINKAMTVLVQTSAFPSINASNAVGSQIIVDGQCFKIIRREQVSDGATTHLLVSN
jgi:hypothetical protein